jgi:hypothetical protein
VSVFYSCPSLAPRFWYCRREPGSEEAAAFLAKVWREEADFHPVESRGRVVEIGKIGSLNAAAVNTKEAHVTEKEARITDNIQPQTKVSMLQPTSGSRLQMRESGEQPPRIKLSASKVPTAESKVAKLMVKTPNRIARKPLRGAQQSNQQFQQNEQQNRQNAAKNAQQSNQQYQENLQQNRQNFANNYSNTYGGAGANGAWYGGGSPGTWGGYYTGLGVSAAAGLAMGATIASLPEQSVQVEAQGNPYYYANGVYYAPQGNSYAVVPPPKGAVIPSVPESSTTVYGAGKNYVYNNGVFYDPAGQGFKIVDPPPGLLVPSIPNGAATVTVNGAKYREFGGVWYRPFYSGSDVVYQTVRNPVG